MIDRYRIIDFFNYVLGFPKTVYFNLRCLGLGGLLFPIIVSHKTTFRRLSGNLKIEDPKFGLVKIGFGRTQVSDFRYDRTIINMEGTWHIKGKCKLGVGCTISIGPDGVLTTGNDFNATAKTSILCAHKITFGDHNLISWDCLIMDTDQHRIKDLEGNSINEDQPVVLGDNVWVGCRTSVLKGVTLPSDCIVGASSNVTGSFNQSNCIIAGNPAKIIKTGVSWE